MNLRMRGIEMKIERNIKLELTKAEYNAIAIVIQTFIDNSDIMYPKIDSVTEKNIEKINDVISSEMVWYES